MHAVLNFAIFFIHLKYQLFVANIFRRIVFSNTVNLCRFFSVNDHVLQPYKRTDKIITFNDIEINLDNKRLCEYMHSMCKKLKSSEHNLSGINVLYLLFNGIKFVSTRK